MTIFPILNQYILALSPEPKGAIEPLPEIKVIESFMFNPEGLRDPFKPLVQPEQNEAAGAIIGWRNKTGYRSS